MTYKNKVVLNKIIAKKAKKVNNKYIPKFKNLKKTIRMLDRLKVLKTYQVFQAQ
jgi:hypothetical protein